MLMKKMLIKFPRTYHKNYQFFIDGEQVTPTRTKHNNEIVIETEKDNAELVIYNTLHLRSPFWLLYSAIFYLISVFGIFNIGKWRDVIFSHCKIIIPIQDGEELLFAPGSNKRDQNAFFIEGRIPLEIQDNKNYLDPIAKRRRTILRILQFICTLAVLVIAALIVVAVITL